MHCALYTRTVHHALYPRPGSTGDQGRLGHGSRRVACCRCLDKVLDGRRGPDYRAEVTACGETAESIHFDHSLSPGSSRSTPGSSGSSTGGSPRTAPWRCTDRGGYHGAKGAEGDAVPQHFFAKRTGLDARKVTLVLGPTVPMPKYKAPSPA